MGRCVFVGRPGLWPSRSPSRGRFGRSLPLFFRQVCLSVRVLDSWHRILFHLMTFFVHFCIAIESGQLIPMLFNYGTILFSCKGFNNIHRSSYFSRLSLLVSRIFSRLTRIFSFASGGTFGSSRYFESLSSLSFWAFSISVTKFPVLREL